MYTYIYIIVVYTQRLYMLISLLIYLVGCSLQNLLKLTTPIFHERIQHRSGQHTCKLKATTKTLDSHTASK